MHVYPPTLGIYLIIPLNFWKFVVCVCLLSGLWNRAVWPNYEVVVFQASVSDCSITRLCRVMINTFILAPRPTCLSRFLDYFVSHFLPPPISSVRHLRTSHLHPLPTSFPGRERRPTGRRPHPPPASLRRSLCTPRRMPESSIVSRIVCPPVAELGLHPGPC